MFVVLENLDKPQPKEMRNSVPLREQKKESRPQINTKN